MVLYEGKYLSMEILLTCECITPSYADVGEDTLVKTSVKEHSEFHQTRTGITNIKLKCPPIFSTIGTQFDLILKKNILVTI